MIFWIILNESSAIKSKIEDLRFSWAVIVEVGILDLLTCVAAAPAPKEFKTFNKRISANF